MSGWDRQGALRVKGTPSAAWAMHHSAQAQEGPTPTRDKVSATPTEQLSSKITLHSFSGDSHPALAPLSPTVNPYGLQRNRALAHYMTVQSALPRGHPRPADHGLATRPIHEIYLT
eukprot:1110792-Prymnesium_polylepis.1